MEGCYFQPCRITFLLNSIGVSMELFIFADGFGGEIPDLKMQ